MVKVLLTAEQLHAGVERLAREVQAHYQAEPVTLLGVLTGSLIFVADLIRLLDLPLRVSFVQARSYRGKATSPGELSIQADMIPDIRGRHVLLADDIFDTGRTLQGLVRHLSRMGPASVRSAVLLRKQGRQQVDLQPDHVAFDIPDRFVVGYGLDFDDHYRHLPYIALRDDDPAEGTRP